MTLQQLHYVITISETGSMNSAAELLYVAQPSLTGAVKELEKELGITIFHRSGRGVSLTNEGLEFITHARQVYHQYETLMGKYGKAGKRRKKFGVSAQHYSFAVKGFVETVKQYDAEKYDFAIRETTTKDVIDDVITSKSEIGILYLSDFNRKAIEKLLKRNELEFHTLTECDAYVYMWKGHPLADKESVGFDELAEYPCLSFEQGAEASFYFAEEIFSTNEYPRTVKATDRATMLNLMVGLNGYTLCSGIICEELNGSDYTAVPLKTEDAADGKMEIGYILKKKTVLSSAGELYIKELREYLSKSAL